jgi:DNA-binding transcriptional ArsR family regulator
MATESAAQGPDEGADGDEQSLPLGPQPLPDLVEFRRIEDAATIKALADPLRLRIMRVLGHDARTNPRIMTVKQIAEELGEPTTKLYRHIKQLVAAGLIQIAELRLVGGIVEQHYRVAQAGWGVHPGGYESPTGERLPGEVYGIAAAAVVEFFKRYETALREGRTSLNKEENLKIPPYIRSVGAISDYRIPREKAAEFAERLHLLVGEFVEQADERNPDADTVDVNLMAVFYATTAED